MFDSPLVQAELEAEWNARYDYVIEANAGMGESLAALEAETEFRAEQEAARAAEAGEVVVVDPRWDDIPF